MSDCESVVYFKLIRDAMKQVASKYIVLDVAGGSPKHRERVYCYELYHQMRCLQKQGTEYINFTINGEIDKSGSQEVVQNFNPDFVMHTPGNMENNGCVIEVKAKSNSNRYVLDKEGVNKDLKTITCMLHCYKYQYGALIFVDVTEGEIAPILQEAEISHLDDIFERVMVFFQNKNVSSNISCKRLKEILEINN